MFWRRRDVVEVSDVSLICAADLIRIGRFVDFSLKAVAFRALLLSLWLEVAMGSGIFDLVKGKDRGSANGSSRSSVRFIPDIEPEICCPTIGGEEAMAVVYN